MASPKTKVCSKCRRRRLIGEFTRNRTRKDGRCPSCKSCHRSYVNKHYAENKSYYKEKAVSWRARARKEITAVIVEAKAVPCADCSEEYPSYVMDFDHVRGEKKYNVSEMTRSLPPLEDVLEEIAKCDVVCSNCHRERTYGHASLPR